MSDDEDFYSDDEELNENQDVQLGFIEKGRENQMFKESDWNNWDGGIIGGKPIWLNPVQIPRPDDLTCSICRDPLVFLLQIYCPLDIPDTAFHRALYVFCCHRENCMNQDSIKCFRNQLAKENDFYGNNGDSKTNKKILELLPNLCEVCGCCASSVCSRCKVMRYCSRNHQKNHWKMHKLTCGLSPSNIPISDISTSVHIDKSMDIELTDDNKSTQLFLFPEYDLIVNQEELEDIGEVDKTDESVVNANIWEDAITEGGDDESEDAKLTQVDYSSALGNESSDPVYTRFIERIRRGGSDQVIRYCRWDNDARLMISSNNKLKNNEKNNIKVENIPHCPHCGSERKFEFQILPQLLYYLHVDKSTKVLFPTQELENNREEKKDFVPNSSLLLSEIFNNNKKEDIDWGTIDIFTCTASCDINNTNSVILDIKKLNIDKVKDSNSNSAYIEEYIFRQAPPSLNPIVYDKMKMEVMDKKNEKIEKNDV